jgi:Na+/H+-dicarboxylate symporter
MKNSLLLYIIIAIAAGIGAGYVLPHAIARCFVTFNDIFSSFLGFVIPLLIVGFVAPAIADIGQRAGKMLITTVLIAYVMTFGAGTLSYFTADATFPGLIGVGASIPDNMTEGTDLEPYFTITIEPLMTVMTALVLAFVLGLGTSRLKTTAMRNGLNDFRDIITMVIRRVIIPLLSVYIFGIFMSMTIAGKVGPILATFVKIILVIFALHVGVLLIQYFIASLFSRRNPFKCLWTMMPAYFTALGTQSSAATIPVTLSRTIEMGVNKDIAGFVIPLCATIHMSGSILKVVACALAIMITHGISYDYGLFAGFIGMLAITIIAAPGVPGGAIMASLGLLSSMLGFSEADNAMMIALYIAMDSFGTACNITGDGAIAQIIDRIFSKSDTKTVTE